MFVILTINNILNIEANMHNYNIKHVSNQNQLRSE